MARDFDGDGDKCLLSSAPSFAGNFVGTVFCRFKLANLTGDKNLWAVSEGRVFDSTNDEMRLWWNDVGGSAGHLQLSSVINGSTNYALKPTTVTSDTNWHTAVMRSDGDEITMFYDGGSETVIELGGTTNDGAWFGDHPDIDRWCIGGLQRDVLIVDWAGGGAEFAVWDVVLTQDEVTALENGVSPNMIRRKHLVHYSPLYGVASPEPDLSGNKNNLVVSGATQIDHRSVGRYVPYNVYPIDLIVKQTARPDGDISIGSWTDDGGGTTNIYQAIDEVTPNDSDFIRSELNPSNSKCEIRLSDVTDPVSAVRHGVPHRYGKDSANQTIDMTIRLKQGVTVIASKTHSNIPTGWTQDKFELTTTEINNITDYDDLRLEFEADAP